MKLETILEILQMVRSFQPVNFYQLSKRRRIAYLTAYRYFKWCIQHGLLERVKFNGDSTRNAKYYRLSEKGKLLLRLFENGEKNYF